MTTSEQDRFARRVVTRLGREPEVDDAVAARLAHARTRALAIAAGRREPAVLAAGGAATLGGGLFDGWRRWVLLASGLAIAAMLRVTPHQAPEHAWGWDASADDSPYVELLR